MMFPKHSILDLWPGSEDTYLSISSNLLAEWPCAMYCMIHIQNPAYYRKFGHSQAYSCLIKTYLEPCVTLAIQNSAVFRILACLESKIYSELKAYSGIFRTLCNTRIKRTLPYSELCHIQNFGIFRTQSIFRILLIWAYSGIFWNIRQW